MIEGFFGASHSFEEAVVGFKVDLETGQTFGSTLGNDVYTDDYGTNAFTSIERYIMTGQADIMRGDDTGDVFEMGGATTSSRGAAAPTGFLATPVSTRRAMRARRRVSMSI